MVPSRLAAVAWAALALMVGGSLLAYLLGSVPPTLADNRLNIPAVTLFFLGLFLLSGGLASLIALALHSRWPTLAGVRSRRARPAPGVALRQGVLLAVAVLALALLAFFQFLDVVFVLVTFLLVGLLEAFLQSRGR
ncbi:hypothetical protein FKZ61_001250 [Litorilinea aerophila]|uniref:Uncharacterized protein n=1 Tax=Litorilinea aerophila TaxID=1204385 RepID=A0A540VMP7_9CHLR|nr:hypothetical protein [Litorilinea aerophila]MCC9074743.1 hypothetical protein [Litorilinea aerophila]GIV75922.1 MAG: hypothetical protein KatS3mg050_0316 [Litorilinea sp.]